ncbi:NADH-quinone oxidoreductase subunit N [bacterium]|nr:NADH-quinone oxidoreductase subunit N [bacterium]
MRSLLGVSPVLILTFGSLFVLTAGLWVKNKGFQFWTSFLSLIVAFGLFLGLMDHEGQDLFSGMLSHDPIASFFGLFSVAATALIFVFSWSSKEVLASRRSEFYSLLLAMATGLVFMGSANHFLMIYLAVETVSILSYCLAGFHREKGKSVEASLKYVVYGSMASAIMIFGMSLLFGVTGQFTLTGMREFFATTEATGLPVMMWVGVLLTFAGLAYKVSAAPMHMWTPDVYEGSPTPVSAFLSVAPKAAGLALLIRFFVVGFSQSLAGTDLAIASIDNPTALAFHPNGAFNWPHLLMISSIFTMFMGNLAALGQTSVKRILAYSSIAHAGYMLMGLTAANGAGIAAIMYYVVVYCLMNVGAFWVAAKVNDTLGGDDLEHFRGLIQRRPLYAICMAIFLFSLVGLPPMAGFIGKYYLFQAILGRELYALALIAAVNSVISLWYYMKIAKAMILEEPQLPFPSGSTPFESKSSKVFIVLLAVPNIVLGLYWEPLMNAVRDMVALFIG